MLLIGHVCRILDVNLLRAIVAQLRITGSLWLALIAVHYIPMLELLRIFLISRFTKAIKADLNAKIGCLAHSKHINKLLISFIFTMDQGLYRPVFCIVHRGTLAIITTARLIQVGRFIDENLTELVDE